MAGPITNWVDGRIKIAVDEAMSQLRDDLDAELQTMQNTLTAQITSLPGLLVSQFKNFAVDTEGIANEVYGKFINSKEQWIQQVVQGVLAGLPSIFNPFQH